jgi:UDP-N-acetylmuramoylalanine--D-glutamate ligase
LPWSELPGETHGASGDDLAKLINPPLKERARARFGGRRATVLGLGREGVDLARFLSDAGASVKVTDQQSADALQAQVAALEGRAVEMLLGEQAPEPLLEADVLFASPGVPPEHPLLAAARARGIPVTSLIEALFELCPSPIMGITGSAGKTTTTTLVGEIFRAANRPVFVGGNIGKPLLGELERMTPEAWVVLELSSFQLESMRQSPRVAVVTNVTPNHLDRHPSMEAYWDAKRQILAHQQADDIAVLNDDDTWSRRYKPNGRVLRFSLQRPVEGAYLDSGTERLMLLGEPLMKTGELLLRGRHNVANVLAASLAAHAAGIGRKAVIAAAKAFRGVAHRLEVVGERDGVRFVNDSIATAPERSMAALRAFEEPLVVIAGGRDKHLPMGEWAELLVRRARHVVLLGEMAEAVAEALRAADPSFRGISRAASMDEAVAQAADAARSGNVVLLSPGGTSFDMYQDFEKRGEDFTRAVGALGGEARPA